MSVFRRKFVSFLEPNENTSTHAHTIRLLGECVHEGGYNVTSEILSFLSPARRKGKRYGNSGNSHQPVANGVRKKI